MLYYMSAYMFVTPKDLVLPFGYTCTHIRGVGSKSGVGCRGSGNIVVFLQTPKYSRNPRLKLQALASNPR